MTLDRNRRVLVIDDNRAIHEDFRKILAASTPSSLGELEGALFGDTQSQQEGYEVDSAYQGEEGFERVRRARAEGRPYALAYVDMRMPPGWDGAETIEHIWGVDQEIHVVICTAYSDHDWGDMIERCGSIDRLLIIRKPFDTVEVRQLARALTEKWRLGRQAELRLQTLKKSLAVAVAIQEAVQDGILIVDPTGKVVGHNKRFAEIWRIPPEIVEGSNDEDLIKRVTGDLVDPDPFLARVQHLYRHPDEVSEEQIRLKDGRVLERWTGPVRSEQGEVYGRLWCFRDVTRQSHPGR